MGSGSFSYLLTWRGSDASLAPALFISHVDVVPVTKGTEQDWTLPPFSGAVADGFIWGEKHAPFGQLCDPEALLRSTV